MVVGAQKQAPEWLHLPLGFATRTGRTPQGAGAGERLWLEREETLHPITWSIPSRETRAGGRL